MLKFRDIFLRITEAYGVNQAHRNGYNKESLWDLVEYHSSRLSFTTCLFLEGYKKHIISWIREGSKKSRAD